MKPAHTIIKRPLLTEKGTVQTRTGGNAEGSVPGEDQLRKKIFFEVSLTANKVEIKQAIESLFSVKVDSVHTSIVRGKDKRVGRFTGRRSTWKKAVVTLQPGEQIQVFEGV